MFSKSKTNEIKRNLYEIENEKSLFESKRKEIQKNLTELEENLSKTKKCYDYDDIEYIEYRGIKNGSETDEIIEELFKSFLQKYQEGLEGSMRGSEFVYDSADALYYNLNKSKFK